MPLPPRNSLLDLQQRCCMDVFDSETFRSAPGALTGGELMPPREATPAERLAVHTIVETGVRWFASNQPDRLSRRAWERFNGQVAEQAEKSIELVCGVGILVGALLSWLIGQALTWLWNWFKQTHNAPQLVCGMVA